MHKGKRGNRTAAPQQWDDPMPRWMRAAFWRRERMARDRDIDAEVQDALRHGEIETFAHRREVA